MVVMVENNGLDVLTAPEVAEILTVSKRIVYRLVADGELKSIKIRGSLRIYREGLEEYITKQSE